MQEKVDVEISKIIDYAYKEALSIVTKRMKVIDKVVVALLKDETLGRDEFERIVGKKTF